MKGVITHAGRSGKQNGDDFWVKAETLLYTALIGCIHYETPKEEQNFSTLIKMINAMEAWADDEEFNNAVDMMFNALEAENPIILHFGSIKGTSWRRVKQQNLF